MEFSERELQKLYATLSHPVRRRILEILQKGGKVTFTDLMNELKIPETGRLSYHLNQMQPLLNQDEEKRYYLSPLGKLAISIEEKALEELKIKPLKLQPGLSFWIIVGLCGFLGWLLANPSCGTIGVWGLIVSGVLLGVILTYRFEISERQSAKAGFVAGVISGTLTAMVYIVYAIYLHIFYASSSLVIYTYGIIWSLIFSPIVFLIFSTLTTLILRSIFRIHA